MEDLETQRSWSEPSFRARPENTQQLKGQVLSQKDENTMIST